MAELPFRIPLLASLVLHAATAQDLQDLTVTVTIDFGPLGRPALHGDVRVPAGASVVDATRALAAVAQDWLCCAADDVWSIAGVGPDPRLDRAWSWELGDAPGPDRPARHRLAPGDRIRWRYSGRAAPPPPSARVVSLLPAATEICIAIGAERALVGLSHLCRQPDGGDLPRVLTTTIDSARWEMGRIDREVHAASAAGQPLYRIDEERLGALSPTVVISQGLCPVCAATPAHAAGALDCPPADRAALLVLTPHTLADVARDIRAVGRAVGRQAAAEVAARAFERRLEQVRAAAANRQRLRVVVLEWFDPLWVSGEWIAELVLVAGGEPLLAGPGQPSLRITWDELAAADPDVLVLAACSMDIPRTAREARVLAAHPQWSQLRAVRSDRVVVLDGSRHTSTPGPALAEGAELLAAILADPDGFATPAVSRFRQPAPR